MDRTHDARAAATDDTLTGELVRIGVAVVLFAIAGLWVTHYVNLARMMIVTLEMNDFGKFYYSTIEFLAGRDIYAPTPATSIPVDGTDKHFWNLNPPHFHLLMLPFALLTPVWALVAWAAANAAAFVWAVVLIGAELRVRWTYWRAAAMVFAAIICSATGAIVLTAQFGFLLALPITLAWIAARRGAWTRAGVLLGLIVSVKPFLAIVGLVLLLQRHWRALGAMLATIAAAFAVGLLVFGVGAHVSWLGRLGAVDWEWASMNASIHGLLSRTLTDNPLYVHVAHWSSLAWIAGLALSAVVVAVSAVVIARERGPSAVDRAFAITLLVAHLVSPLGWLYYVWVLLGPLWALVRTWDTQRSAARMTLLALAVPGFVCPISVVLFWRSIAWATPFIGSIYTWSLLFVWLATVVGGSSGRSSTTLEGLPIAPLKHAR